MISKTRKLIIVGSVIAVAIIGIVVYAEWTDSNPPTKSGLYFKVEKLTDVPEQYWNLTDPDPYILEAINNPNVWVQANESSQTFMKQLSEHHWLSTICYNGTFYKVEAMHVDNWEKLQH